MSSGHVAPQMEAHVRRCQPDSLNLTVVDACINQPPSTEVFRSQQFMDITDDLGRPPPYLADIADSYIVVRDLHNISSSNLTKMLPSCDRFSSAILCQSTGAGDFILFQDEVLWTDDGDISSSDPFSSQVSCCSDVSIETSPRSSAPPSTSALKGQQRSVVVEPARADIEQYRELNETVDSARVVEWLQIIMPSPQEVVPCLTTSSDHSNHSSFRLPENGLRSQQDGRPFRS